MNPISRYFQWLQKGNPVGEVVRFPILSSTYETNVKGIYAIGDLSGLPLLRFAAQQGYEVTNNIYHQLKSQGIANNAKVYDVVIVGAGAGGLSSGLEAKKHGLSYVILEGARIANTVVNFPKGKLIFAEPKQLIYKSQLPVVQATKEDTLAAWYKIIAEEKLNIRQNAAVKDIKKRDEALFDVILENDQVVQGKRIILAIGKAGKSRKLDVPGEQLQKVTDVLRDPGEYEGQRLLVVGGGDSAIETACALADTGNEVTLSYRKGEFTRIKEGNAERIAHYQKEGKLKVLFNSQVKEITETSVYLKTESGEITLVNDMVFTMLGSELPYDFLKRIGLKIENTWSMVRAALFAFSLTIFSIVYFGKHYYHTDLFGQSPGFWYGLLYTMAVGVFGIKRIIEKPTPYIRNQTITLFLIQALPLFILPNFLLPYMGEHGLLPTFAENYIFPYKSYWYSYNLILPWPLLTYGLATDQPINYFWVGLSLVQTFVIVPLLVRYWGKGAICGWICSCGALAETLGDSYRTLAPHGAKAKKWENFGQVVLFFITIITALSVISWFYPSETLFKITRPAREWYTLIVDVGISGALALGTYFFFSGRIWCRYACPLASLMHIYGKFSQYRIFSDKKKCISCGVCTKSCHMGIDVASYAIKGTPMDDVECVRCSACVTNCPMSVLSFGRIGTGHPHDPTTSQSKRSLPVLNMQSPGK
ncbi:MAG: NAD(P)-binding domain-containing protein [Acidobacteriota bacterium]